MRNVAGISAATCLFITALAATIPMIPFKARDLGADGALVGLMFSAFGASALLAAPLWGRVSDRIGRRPVMLGSAAISCAAYLWLGLAETLPSMLAARTLGGLGFGWVAAAQALASDTAPETKRASAIGLVGAAFGIGFTVGPAIQSLLYELQLPLDAIAYVSAGLCVAAFLSATQLPPGRRPDRHETAMRWRDLRGTGARLLLIYGLVFVGFTGTEATIALFVADELGMDAGDVGMLLLVAGLANACVQGGVVGRLVPRLGELRTAMLGHGSLVVGAGLLIAAGASGTVWLTYLAMIGFAAGLGLHAPSLQTALSRIAGEQGRGTALGAAQSASMGARIIGPSIAGGLYSATVHSAPFVLTAMLAVCAALLAAGTTLPRDSAAARYPAG